MSKYWWLYIVECHGGGLYIGIARDLDARLRKHRSGQGAFYTRQHPPVRLLAKQRFSSYREARRAERAAKRLAPGRKRMLVDRLRTGDKFDA